MINSQLRDVQLIELEMLIEVARVCDENGIEYFLDSGTALGAIRHKGFIPWDDDIDIGMTRENYDKFLKIAPEKLGEDYFMQSRYTDKNCPYIFAKVRKNKTVFMEWNKRNINMHHGIYIDIFPYDNVPNDETRRKNYFKKCRLLYRLFLIRSIPDRDLPPENSMKWVVLAFIRKTLHWIFKIIPISLIERRLNELFQKYNQNQTEYLTCHVFSKSYVFKKKDLFPTKQVKFEKHYFHGVNNIDKYLKVLYGNYMNLPPEDKRKGHMPYKVQY